MSRKSKNRPLKEKVAIFVEGPTEKKLFSSNKTRL